MTGSAQQMRYLALRAKGTPIDDAEFQAGLLPGEGAMVDRAVSLDELKVTDGYLLAPAESPAEVATPQPQISADLRRESPTLSATPASRPTTLFERMSAAARTTNEPAQNIPQNIPEPIPAAGEAALSKEPAMARRPSSKRAAESLTTVEEKKPDFKQAVAIYREDIKPAAGKVGEHAQEMSTAYKELKKLCGVHPGAAKLVFRLDDMEESKRDDWLRTFKGLCKELSIFMPSDLVDAAEGKEDGDREVVETAPRAGPKLATMGGAPVEPPAGDADLNDGDVEESVVDKAQREAGEQQAAE